MATARPVKPLLRIDLNQLAFIKPGAIQNQINENSRCFYLILFCETLERHGFTGLILINPLETLAK